MTDKVTFETLVQDFRERVSEVVEPAPSDIQTALQALESESTALLPLVAEGRLQYLFGHPIAGIVLDEPLDSKAAQTAMQDFFKRFLDLYGLDDTQVDSETLAVSKVGVTDHLRLMVQQYHHKLPVLDGGFTVIFDAQGRLTQIAGWPYGASELPTVVKPSTSQEDGIKKAIAEVITQYPEQSPPAEAFEAAADLAISGTHQALVWRVELVANEVRAIHAELWVDAMTGEVLTSSDQISCGERRIWIRHYSHPGGVRDSTGDLASSEGSIDARERPARGGGMEYDYSLQRLGSGRARIWNAKSNQDTHPPQFSRTSGWTRTPPSTTQRFNRDPDSVYDPNSDGVFNEQQTYVWAQMLKTQVDNWGRRQNEDSLGHYPVDAERDVNVEIVVNAHASREVDWCNLDTDDPDAGVMHGCFRGVPKSWFPEFDEETGTVPAVILFNHPANVPVTRSPQFFGPEISASYSIIVHEVGHFISWQYGGWEGPANTNLGSSFSEGFSMVMAALVGKTVWPSLTYQDAWEVATGSRQAGQQWMQHNRSDPPQRYDQMHYNDNPYVLAWPFVQAMWHLMNNVDENGNPIWGSDEAAIQNTADLLMWGLYHCTQDRSLHWNTLSWMLLMRMLDRIEEGTELEPLGDHGRESWNRVVDVIVTHGLLGSCTFDESILH